MALRWPLGVGRAQAQARNLVERFNLQRVYYWLGLASAVGVVGGLGALAFKWLTDEAMGLFWPRLVGFAPQTAGGEPSQLVASGPFHFWGLMLAPAIGGVLSGFLVYRFAPEAAGHGTDAAIRAYHREGGRIPWRIPIVKLFASALTIGSGGSAGREGPIAQIGAGFGSVLGGALKLSERERRILLAAGVSAGIGAIFRAPFAGAVFGAEVLYREPDIEAEVLVPSLLASIVSYSVYCSVHGFGHLFTGTSGLTLDDPLALLCYATLGVVLAFVGISYVTTLARLTAWFKRLRISNYAKPAIGGLLVGIIGAVSYAALDDTSVLAVMGSGYGTVQRVIGSHGALGIPVVVLVVVMLGKIVTTSLTIGSGGSGGVFGPSMVIGGCVGALVGTAFHALTPSLVPDVAPFTIVGMAGFFAGVAKTPISTLLMVGELTGNYELLLPSMLAVCLPMIIAHHWTIYPEQVATRASSPAHRDELVHDALAGVAVGAALDAEDRRVTVGPETKLRDVLKIADQGHQQMFPVLGPDNKLVGVLSADVVREVMTENPVPGLVIAQDLLTPQFPELCSLDSLQRALELLATQDVAELPVTDANHTYIGILDRRAIIRAYRRRLSELSSR
ncbi:MAG: chloride channel protein [Deltaproteobacteria bacterium]